MKRWYCIMAFCGLGLGWSGCGLLRQTDKTEGSSRRDSISKTEVSVKDEKTAAKQTLSLTINKDSTGAIYQLLVWPKGRFTFSSEKGFEGEADSIQLNGENWAFENHSEILSTDEQQTVKSAVQGKQEVNAKSVQEKRTTSSYANYKLIIGAVVFIFLLLFLVFRSKACLK